jgi:putative ABC transport system permease protein
MPDWRHEVRTRVAPLSLEPAREREIVEEMAQHLDDRYEELRAAGATGAEAARILIADLDARTLADDLLRAERAVPLNPPVLGASRGYILADAWHDLRYGARALRKSGLFAAAALVTLTLGIGANTAMFSVLYGVLLKPLPFPEPERLVQIWGSVPAKGWTRASLAHANFWDLRDQNRTFAAVGAITWTTTTVTLTGRGDPEQLDAALVSAGFFGALSPTPALGRTFIGGEDEAGGDTRVAVLSHRLWMRRFGGDASIRGQTLRLDGTPFTVIGVLPPGAPWLDAGDIFLPLVHRPDAGRSSFELLAVGRLRKGVSIDAARADVSALARRLAAQYPKTNQGLDFVIAPPTDWVANETQRRALWILLGAVGFLLLIACVNVVNLLLARATGRTREIALRAALGASRGRIVRQLLAESFLLGTLGATLGVLLAWWIVRALRTADVGIARLAEIEVNAPVLAFTIAVMLAISFITGLLSALQMPYGELVPALRESERGVAGTPRQRRLRSALVAAEVALSFALLVGAGLLLRSFDAVMRVDRGFETARRIMVEVGLPAREGESRAAASARTTQFISDFLSRAKALPGVSSAAAVTGRPLSPGSTGLGIGAQGRPDREGEVPWATWRLITPDYFTVMGIPLLKGRAFTDHDRIGEPYKVVISERVARLLWPGEDPLGRQIVLWKGQSNSPGQVIGVVGDMRERGLADDPTLAVYFPYYGAGWSPIQFVFHTSAAPAAFVPMLRSALAGIDRNVPLSNVQTLDEIVSESMASRRFTLMLLVAFAGLAFVLALGGIHGVLAYSVSKRTAEIGVRVALGASAGGVLRLIVAQGMRPVAIGILAGAVGALALSRLMTSLLFEVTPTDPVTYLAVAPLLVLAAGVACVVPARRALAVDVVAALRAE